MDAKQLNRLLLKEGCYSDKRKTRNGLFAEATWNNFNTDQVYNRLNAGWKTAQYIIVNDCPERDVVILLTRWKSLTADFVDQYLLVYTKSKEAYLVYDSKGNLIGDDAILEELIKKNRLKGIPREEVKVPSASAVDCGDNLILYGVPGCGKSYYIKKKYLSGKTLDQQERVVFHPDYTYSDFVGQILPESQEDENGHKHISYPFKPGPFTRILKKAVADRDRNYYLIIEELNRGNAPAIFGDIFQLLDRVDGVSEYGIDNADIAEAVYGRPDTKVFIPKNLFILATMNTADQNVFTLDTAFKRRWRMKSIVSDFTTCVLGSKTICNTKVSWRTFAETINEHIVECAESSVGSEDKRLGAYFVSEKELLDIDLFSEKVLMYLWNDAFKYEKEKVFKAEYKTLEALLKAFKVVYFDVFSITFEQGQ